jgi:hypothetical protein
MDTPEAQDPLAELAKLMAEAEADTHFCGPALAPVCIGPVPSFLLERKLKEETRSVLSGLFGPEWKGVLLECCVSPSRPGRRQ